MSSEIIEIVFMLIAYSLFALGFLLMLFVFEKHRIEERKERNKIL